GLHGGDNQSLISVHHPDTEGGVTITTDENGGSIQVAAADGIGAALLHCNEISPAFVLLDKASGRVPFQVSYDSEERAALPSKLDGGVLKLKWGGVDGACAMATELGGIVLVKDPDGNTVASMPKREWDGQDEQID